MFQYNQHNKNFVRHEYWNAIHHATLHCSIQTHMLQKKNSSYTITIASKTYESAKQDKGTAHPVTVKHHSPQSDLILIQQSAKTFRKFYYVQLDTL